MLIYAEYVKANYEKEKTYMKCKKPDSMSDTHYYFFDLASQSKLQSYFDCNDIERVYIVIDGPSIMD